MSDLISAVTRSGSADGASSIDELDDDEPLDVIVGGQNDKAEGLANDAFAQLEHRQEHLGATYPFVIDRVLRAAPDAVSSPYAFLLALTHLRDATGAAGDGPSLFEQVSRSALVEYLGGRTRVESYDFGWPRRKGPRTFHGAIRELCKLMGEGVRPKRRRSETAQVKDAKVDVVVWVPFRDERSNQLAVFGQCTTASRWQSKIDELQPRDFCQRWLAEQPAMSPLAAFFVPSHVTDYDWRREAVSDRRLFFDRLRVARLLTDLDSDLGERCAEWTLAALGGGG